MTDAKVTLDTLTDAPDATVSEHPTDERFPVVEVVDKSGASIGDVRTINYTSKAGKITSRVEFRRAGAGRQMMDAYAFAQYARELANLG